MLEAILAPFPPAMHFNPLIRLITEVWHAILLLQRMYKLAELVVTFHAVVIGTGRLADRQKPFKYGVSHY